jgi:hypothetical protein
MVILPFERTTIVYNGFIESPTAVQKNGIWYKEKAQGIRHKAQGKKSDL